MHRIPEYIAKRYPVPPVLVCDKTHKLLNEGLEELLDNYDSRATMLLNAFVSMTAAQDLPFYFVVGFPSLRRIQSSFVCVSLVHLFRASCPLRLKIEKV